MIKLIKNEWKKLFSKKVMYVLLIIVLAYTILNNVLSHIEIDFNIDDYLIADLENELATLDYKSAQDNEYYIDIKTQVDLEKLKRNYEKESWQYQFFDYTSLFYDCIRNINENTYGLQKNEQQLKIAQKELDKLKVRLDSGDWKSFIREDIENTQKQIKYYEDEIKDIKSRKTVDELEVAIENLKVREQALTWRLEKEVPYGDDFLSNKIEQYTYSTSTVKNLKNKENKTKEEQDEYDRALKQMKISEYYIMNDIRIEKEYDARYLLMNLMENYGSFVSIFAIIVAGVIVSNEFQKGTIKLLLTRPFSRVKILLAKYIISLSTICMFILAFMIAQYIIGGIVWGFDSYNIPAIEFDYASNNLIIMPVFTYSLLVTVAKIPIYILLTTLAFALSTITTNSAVSVALPILGNMVAEVFNLFIEKVKILKYFVPANWDLSIYLFGGKGIAEGLNFWLSLIICFIYLTIMLVTTFIVFQKRDIKNV